MVIIVNIRNVNYRQTNVPIKSDEFGITSVVSCHYSNSYLFGFVVCITP